MVTDMNENKIDVLVVGELNVDLILNDLESAPEIGKEKLAGSMTYTLGSSSAIFAANLASLGHRVGFKGKVGLDDFGKKVLLELSERGVLVDWIVKDSGVSTGITVVLNRGEDRAMVTYPGAMEQLAADEVTDEDLSGAGHLHVSSIFLQPGLRKDMVSLFRRAKQAGLTTSLDPQWDPAEQWDLDLTALVEYLDLFIPNEQEFLHLMDSGSVEEGAEQFPNESVLVVKQSNRGATLFHKGEQIHANALLNSDPVDAIGAGDSFNAGFIYKYTQQAPLHECLAFGNLVGAVSTTAAGGTAAIQSLDQVIEVAKEKLGYREP